MVLGLTAMIAGKRGALAGLALFASSILLPAAPAVADDMNDWRRALGQKIGAEFIYPRSAIQREIEGSAKVRVTIDRSGAIASYDVVEPTGESVLDKVIPKMMEKLNPLPAPPASLSDDNLTFVIPLTWRLQ